MTAPAIPRKILVAVAEGGLSDAAVGFAAELADAAHAELSLLHVAPDEKTAAERKPALVRELAARAPALGESGIGSRLALVAGPPQKVVVERAKEGGADLIVLGTSGKAKELDFGGVARAVLSHAPCPVLLVPREARPVKKLLVPVDLSPASLRALGIARDWARLYGAKLLAIHCFSVPELVAYGIPEAPLAPVDFGLDDLRASAKERFEREMRAFAWDGVPWDARLFDDGPEQTLLEIQDEFDLIVMSTHGHTGIAAALLGSVAYNVLRRTRTPALVCPIRD